MLNSKYLGLTVAFAAALSVTTTAALAQTGTPTNPTNSAGTNSTGTSTNRNTPTVTPTSGTSPSANAIPDTQIAKILMTINEGEIDAGKVAKSNAQSKAVKDFATMMVDQHEKNSLETKELAKRHKINPEDNDTAKMLYEETKNSNRDLKRSGKADFDRAYLKQQITMHEKALSTLDDTLIPSAQNREIKAHLEKTRTAVSQHLQHAKDLQTKL